jgi:tRNA-uridine 2-sulfurtransferase
VKVVIAMSGGVDSSVAALLLKEEGHEVIGMTMQLTAHSAAIEAAKEVADKLGIPHYVIDLHDIFTRTIINDFCQEYSQGRTPNPCIRCNELIKFGALRGKAAEIGADYLATGHYARIQRNGSQICLKKGTDTKKDQSYFLCRLNQEQLKHVLFPIGHLTKTRVRQIALEKGLPTAARPESQEICFIPDNDHAEFLKSYMPQASQPGPILDGLGNILGEHHGIMAYTIGQRHGLGIATAEPLYVTAIAPDLNALIVGTKEQTYGMELAAGNLNWTASKKPDFPINIKAKVRYRHPEAEATVNSLDNENVHVKFAIPQTAITPGQTIAFYDGENIIGGGTIIRQGR